MTERHTADPPRIAIACAADERYAPHSATMLHSLAARHGAAIEVHYLRGADMLPATQVKLRQVVEGHGARIVFHDVAERDVADLPAMGRISRVMWYRLFLPRLLPHHRRILYLDCDTIIMDDLWPLWGTDLGGFALGAVSNVAERGMEHRVYALGLTEPAQYFNSGVLLMDLAQWRDQGLAQQVLDYARSHPVVWPDQDALNAVLAGRWLPLHPRWNCQNSFFFFPQAAQLFATGMVREATRRPGILHFEGGELAKPWHFLSKHPYRAEYYRHRAHTPWPVTILEGRTWLNRALRPLPVRGQIVALSFVRRARRAVSQWIPAWR